MSKRQRRNHEKRRRHQLARTTGRKLATGTGLTVGATLALAGSAQATDFTVKQLGDAGDNTCDATCTLRDAVDDANNNSGPDRILFQSGLSGTIQLANPQLRINDPVEILGPGAGTLAVTTYAYNRIAYIYTDSNEPVLISGLTLTGGNYEKGGAIYSGAGFANHQTPLTISNSVLTGNHSVNNAGAVWVSGGSLHVESSTVSGNTADNAGGGIYFYDSDENAQSTIRNSTISGNTVTAQGGNSDDGGAIYLTVAHAQSQLLIENSTLSNNSVPDRGGAIYDDAVNGPVTTLTSSTISNNSAGDDGGGIVTFYGETLQNTIVANNSAGDAGPDLFSEFSAPFNTAFSLVENPSGATITETVPGSNVLGVDPQLGPLADNGGPTQTMALAQSSPAVDKGSGSLGTDQRGSPRPFDFATIPNSSAAGADASDIGAFELQPPAVAAAPKCKGKTATVFRSNGRKLTGTNKRDVIVGTKSKDKISSRGGNDLVCAKGGNDTVNGGGGKDKLFGQGGKDKLKGAGGNDKLVGGAKKDKLIGGAGADKLLGKGGNDTCVGGPGRDVEKSC
jgi:parallel beta-helix repeat protein